MKKLFKLAYFIAFVLILSNCSKEYEVPDNIIVHDFVWKGLNAYYLYQEQITDLSDTRFSSDQELNTYLNTFTDYNSLFSSLLLSGDIKSALIDDYTTLDNISLRTENGFEFGAIIEPGTTENIIGFVYYVLPNSDAETKGLLRGDFFNRVNGGQLTKSNYQNLLLNSTTDYTLNMVDFNGTTVTSNGKSVTLKSETYNAPPIFLEKTITAGANNIGYLLYNNDFSTNYINDLNNTFLNFKNQVKKCILF